MTKAITTIRLWVPPIGALCAAMLSASVSAQVTNPYSHFVHGTQPGSLYFWIHGNGPGSAYFWQHGQGFLSRYHWEQSNLKGSAYYWRHGRGLLSQYMWEHGPNDGMGWTRFQWQQGQTGMSEYGWTHGRDGPASEVAIALCFGAGLEIEPCEALRSWAESHRQSESWHETQRRIEPMPRIDF